MIRMTLRAKVGSSNSGEANNSFPLRASASEGSKVIWKGALQKRLQAAYNLQSSATSGKKDSTNQEVASEASPFPMKNFIQTIESGQDLNREEISWAAECLLGDDESIESKAAFLKALAAKGESPVEIASFADAFLDHAVNPGINPSDFDAPVIDVCGHGRR